MSQAGTPGTKAILQEPNKGNAQDPGSDRGSKPAQRRIGLEASAPAAPVHCPWGHARVHDHGGQARTGGKNAIRAQRAHRTRARSMRSLRRPGVATRMSQPRSMSRSCTRHGQQHVMSACDVTVPWGNQVQGRGTMHSIGFCTAMGYPRTTVLTRSAKHLHAACSARPPYACYAVLCAPSAVLVQPCHRAACTARGAGTQAAQQ